MEVWIEVRVGGVSGGGIEALEVQCEDGVVDAGRLNGGVDGGGD